MMSNQLPLLNSGAITQYPFQRDRFFSTIVKQFADFSEQRYQQLGTALGRWVISLSAIDETEMKTLENFFNSMSGKYGSFTFIDPADNLLPYSEDFTKWTADAVALVGGGNQAQPDPLGGSAASLFFAPSAPNSLLVNTPVFDPSGYTVTASIWLKVPSGTMSIGLSLGQNDAAGIACAVTTAWQRFTFTRTYPLASSDAANGVQFKLYGIPASQEIYLFGAQLEATFAATPYKRKTGLPGVHAKCRFDSDTMSIKLPQFGVASSQLVIVETN